MTDPAARWARTMARVRSLVRGWFRRDAVEADMLDEFRHHIELRTRDLVRDGVAPGEAARRARLEFGHVGTVREEARSARGLRLADQLRFSWIDVKLGGRMLVKHPGLTLVAGFALAVGIPVGLAPRHLAEVIEAPLPEDPGNRIRSVRLWDRATQRLADIRYEDYRYWREGLTRFDRLGAHQSGTFVLADAGGPSRSVVGARVTASVFEMLRTPPLLGRGLVPDDELEGAADVAVIGHDLWRARFGSDPDVVGKPVRVAGALHTVVGVMPPGFHFPHLQEVWLPLRRGSGDARVQVIARLADGTTDAEGQAEVTATGLPPRPDEPHRDRLRPEVVPYALAVIGVPRGGLDSLPEFPFFQGAALLLLLVACLNVAMLLFARTATRSRELAVRSALGAGRLRIAAQMFVETLVLAVAAAGAGVAVISWALGRVSLAALVGEPAVPYWLSLQPTATTVLWALALAAVSATVAGVVPALRITRHGIQRTIREADAGRSGVRFGGVTAALVVADVAVAVAVVGIALGLAERVTDRRTADELAGVPADEFLAVEVRLPDADAWGAGPADPADAGALAARRAGAQRALMERLTAEPGVRSVGAADALPRMDHRARVFEVDGGEAVSEATPRWVRAARVDAGYFDALGVPILDGRGFGLADLEGPAATVVVNAVFVERVLGGGDPIGRRIRFPAPADPDGAPWLEIVGVVGHLGVSMVNPEGDEAVYVPAAPGTISPLRLAVRARGAAAALDLPLREIAASVDPDLAVESAVPLTDIRPGDWYMMVAVAGGLALLVAILVALATSALYAIVSFSVTERTREIGIRGALGASRVTLLTTVLRRSLVQIALGALLGLPLAARALSEIRAGDGSAAGAVAAATALAAGIVAVVALTSCLVPARRVLGIEPGDALRTEG